MGRKADSLRLRSGQALRAFSSLRDCERLGMTRWWGRGRGHGVPSRSDRTAGSSTLKRVRNDNVGWDAARVLVAARLRTARNDKVVGVVTEPKAVFSNPPTTLSFRSRFSGEEPGFSFHSTL